MESKWKDLKKKKKRKKKKGIQRNENYTHKLQTWQKTWLLAEHAGENKWWKHRQIDLFFFFNFDVHLTSILTRDVFFLGHTFVSLVIDHSIQEELHFSFSSPSFPRIDKFIFFRFLHTNEFDITN